MSRPFDSMDGECFTNTGLECSGVKLRGGGDALPEPVCLIHLQLIRHGNRASTDLVVFPERNNEELM